MDYQALLYRPAQLIFGVTAVLVPAAASPGELTLSAIDKTAGITVADAREIGVETILPAAVIRMAELIEGGLAATDLSGATLTMNGKAWRVDSYRLVPSPKGEADGEAWLLLVEA